MNGVEFIVIECLKQRKWESALQHLNQLLEYNGKDGMDTEKLLAYLLWRSQCFYELNKHEACIKDCRRIIDLVPNEAPRNNFWFKARWRLTHSLMQLKAFSEAKRIVQQLINLCTDFSQQECIKLLQRINIGIQLASNEELSLDTSTTNDDEKTLFCDSINENYYCEEIKNAGNIHINSIKHILKKQTYDGLQNENHFCIFCNISFENVEKLRDHCSTQSHQRTIMSDEGRDWKKRPPPRGLTADTYNLCPAYGSDAIGNCKNGAQCVDAHGIEELNEWKERFEYRMMKLQRSNETFFYGKSYTELLLNKLTETSNPEMIIRETIDEIEEEIEGELTEVLESKISNKKWIFTLHTAKVLKVVSLLYDSHRNHFSLQRITTSRDETILLDDKPVNTQEWTSRLDMEDEKQKLVHKVELTFSTKLYGTFRQTILFDFGCEPYLVKNLCVDVVPVKDVEKIKEVQQGFILSSTERWEPNTAVIVPFTSTVIDYSNSNREEELLLKYYIPTGHKFTITQSIVNESHVTINNYRSRMHELLYIEEMACYDQVARYCISAKMQVISSYILSPSMFCASTAKFSAGNELFAMITLHEDVSEDSPGGRLVLNNCVTVFLSNGERDEKTRKPKVYVAIIEDKGKNDIYLRLSAQMVTDLKLKPDECVSLEMQFQLNRIPFCEWHHAVDCISNYRIIFPDLVNIPAIPNIEEKKWLIDDAKLNDKQKEAIVAMTVAGSAPLPPVLIIGPFGTGKTYTLARAIKHILLEEDTKILICTHSNSAADLYIKEYLHPYVQSGLTEARPLRIYYHKRWVSTVNSVVLDYCLTEVKNNTRIFKIPTLEDILKHRIIVVTLSISSHLSTIGLSKGYFTHILLDEAAQAIECEAIMPLALANEKTRVVLAGDHMQLSPEVFSPFAKQKNFHVSLLQRLYESYPSDFLCKIVLCENYRAHKAIVEFTSSLFYDDKLISLGDQPKHKKFHPLTFFTALGEDVQECNSTGFYNCAEVYELVERVADLKKDWPECWGKFNENSIGVMTPYPDQVYRIRIELKKRKMGGISVERVLNVQGKQFRAVFLSTVRTARTCCTDETDNGDVSLYDYGFLSNKKLLNTAVTRAQSLVAVVGDPVSLCSIGSCRKIWENFLDICCKNNSFYGLTWQDLKSLLLAVELKKKYKLNPLAPEFIPRCLQNEPYLQFLGAPLTRQPPPGIHPVNENIHMTYPSNCQMSDRVFTYDNTKYQLPPKTVLQSPIIQPSVIPSCPPSTKWNQSQLPLVNPLSYHVNSATIRPSLQSQLRTPPGFSPVQIPSNPLLYQQVSNQTVTNIYQPFPQPATYIPQPIRNNVPESSIPFHLAFIPLPQPQYSRTLSQQNYSVSSNSKTFNSTFTNNGNPVSSQLNHLQNGYKQNTDVVNLQTIPNGIKYSSDHFPYTSSQSVSAPSQDRNYQQETGLEDVLPPTVSLTEILSNLEMQKQWLSYLVESRRIQSAQKFLDLISLHLSNPNQESMIAPSYQNTRPCEVNKTVEFRSVKEATADKSDLSSVVCLFSDAIIETNTIDIDKLNTDDRDYDLVESSIPLDVHFPSSLLPDILPSRSKRRGPLYERHSNDSNTITTSISNGFSRSSSDTSISEVFPKDNFYSSLLDNNITDKNQINMCLSESNKKFEESNNENEFGSPYKYSQNLVNANSNYEKPITSKYQTESQTQKNVHDKQSDIWGIFYPFSKEHGVLDEKTNDSYSNILGKTNEKEEQNDANDKSNSKLKTGRF